MKRYKIKLMMEKINDVAYLKSLETQLLLYIKNL
jgi:hypothetical protein